MKNLFSKVDIPNVLLAERLKHFVRAWGKLIRDQEISEIVTIYTIPMLSKPLQSFFPIRKRSSEIKSVMIAITSVNPQKVQFLSTLFLVPQKGRNQRPVINLKQLNQLIHY